METESLEARILAIETAIIGLTTKLDVSGLIANLIAANREAEANKPESKLDIGFWLETALRAAERSSRQNGPRPDATG